jgi:uncharacterized protein YcnI
MTTRRGRPGCPTRLATFGAATVLASMLFATPAWAHVTVHPETLPAGSADIELTFRVPNERDNADTVGLQVFIPADLPLLTVDVLPVPGWSAKVDTRTLATPITTDDGTVDQVVSDISWTATAGGIAAGQYEDFTIAAGRGPGRPGAVIFKSLQTYSSGEVVRWIQVASSQDPNPDSPAPVLTVTPASTPGPAAATTSSGSTSVEVLAVEALVVGVIGLAGVVVLLVLRRRGPETGSAPSAADPGDDTPS